MRITVREAGTCIWVKIKPKNGKVSAGEHILYFLVALIIKIQADDDTCLKKCFLTKGLSPGFLLQAFPLHCEDDLLSSFILDSKNLILLAVRVVLPSSKKIH